MEGANVTVICQLQRRLNEGIGAHIDADGWGGGERQRSKSAACDASHSYPFMNPLPNVLNSKT